MSSVAGKTLADFPDLVKRIDREKQPGLNPENMAAGSHKKVWWKCPEGPDHEWSTRLQSRTILGHNCPFCPPFPKKVSVTNSFQTKYPEISKEWHPTKNGDLKPKDIISGTHVLFWWKCDKGPDHEWRANPGNRTGRKSNCPCCAGKKVSVTNSLLTLYPDVAKEWHPTKNGELTPESIVSQSHKKIWWKCPKGPDHEWKTTPNSRISKSQNCPICVGQKVVDSNCLATLNPELAKEWHPTKNGELTPKEVTIGTDRKVWWKCSTGGHEWQAAIKDRNYGDGCARCQLVGISKIEIKIAFELYHVFGLDYIYKPRIKTSKRTYFPDIVIEYAKLIVEYDGHIYHNNKFHGSEKRMELDKRNTEELTKEGWTVIRIREEPLEKITDNDIIVHERKTFHNYKGSVDKVLRKIIELGIDVPGVQKYLENDRPIAKRAADEYIAELLREAEQETLNF